MWHNAGLPECRVLPFGMKDYFWKIGETGPYDPGSEIYIDCIGSRSVAELVKVDDPTVLKVWNFVFIHYISDIDGLKHLPTKHQFS